MTKLTHLLGGEAVEGRATTDLYCSVGALAQLGERLVCNQEVAGSIPAGSMPLTMVRKLALLAFVPLALTACGTTEIDAGKTESFIQENVTGPPPRDVE